MKSINILVFFLLVVFGYRPGHAQDGTSINFEKKSFDELVKSAASTQKLVFIDAYATWCGPCKQMERTSSLT